MKTLMNTFQELRRYPSAIIGALIIIALIGLSIYALIALPYQKAITLWRGGEDIWYLNPRTAAPEWVNYFSKTKLPKTINLSSLDGAASKTVTEAQGVKSITLTYTFDYPYDAFPQEIAIFFNAKYEAKQPFASITWQRPDGKEINVGTFSVEQSKTYYMSQDARLVRKLKGVSPEQGLFAADLTAEQLVPLKGTYTLTIFGVAFEPDSDLNAEFVLYGRVYGLAGTDHLRRDLMVALLWGTPIALAFGLLAAFGTTLTTMVIAAFGVWFGGWVDGIIQRVTEVNLVLPFLPILIMVGTFYSRSLWVILGVTILLSIFGGAIKTYRAIFLQVKESPYIEAARAYGAGSGRIILLYLIPRMIPLLIPQLVTLIPSYVFLEASLAVLGLGDPVLPTWGKVIYDALGNGATYQGHYYWILEPAVLLMITGLAFALLGFALDRIFNPRLRGL